MDNNLSKIIGQRINELLASNNVKQKELAKVLCVPDNTISYFCSGKRIPNTEQIRNIAKFFNVSADFLLGLSDFKTNDKDIQFIGNYTGLSEKNIYSLNELNNKIINKKEKYLLERDTLNAFLALSFRHNIFSNIAYLCELLDLGIENPVNALSLNELVFIVESNDSKNGALRNGELSKFIDLINKAENLNYKITANANEVELLKFKIINEMQLVFEGCIKPREEKFQNARKSYLKPYVFTAGDEDNGNNT